MHVYVCVCVCMCMYACMCMCTCVGECMYYSQKVMVVIKMKKGAGGMVRYFLDIQ